MTHDPIAGVLLKKIWARKTELERDRELLDDIITSHITELTRFRDEHHKKYSLIIRELCDMERRLRPSE